MLADHHGGTQRRHRHRALHEDVPSLVTALQMVRQVGVLFAKTAQVDDLLHTRLLGGGCSVARSHAVELGEVAASAHRVHEPVDDVESLEGAVKRHAIKRITLHHLDVSNALEIGIGATHDRAHLGALITELGHEATTDVAGRSDDANTHAGQTTSGIKRRRCHGNRIDHTGNLTETALRHPAVHQVLCEGVRRGDREGGDAQPFEAGAVTIHDHAKTHVSSLDVRNQLQLTRGRGARRTRRDRKRDLDATGHFAHDRGIEAEDRHAGLRNHQTNWPERFAFGPDDAAEGGLQTRPVGLGDPLGRRGGRRQHRVGGSQPVLAMLVGDGSPVFH